MFALVVSATNSSVAQIHHSQFSIIMDVANGANAWTLTGSIAELNLGAFSARVDVSRPELGLQCVAFNCRPLDAQLLRVESDAMVQTARSWPVADTYVRGSDLIATYRPRDDWPYSPQVYWQADASQSSGEWLASFCLFVSVETHLLDTWPRVSVRSFTTAEETIYITARDGGADHRAAPLAPLKPGQHTLHPSTGPSCVLQRLPGGQLSYAEIMPASDFRELVVERDAADRCETHWTLFADFLEKGVIWRARLQSILLPRARDVELALACCRALEQRPLPLTT